MGEERHGKENHMLVQSCMRTASTSLTDFLVNISGKRRHVHPGRIEPKIEGWEAFPSGTASLVPEEVLTDWVCNESYIIQEHILPLEEHREILLKIPEEKRKIVVLKRPGIESWHSQCKRLGHGDRCKNDECRDSFIKFRDELDVCFPETDGYLHVEMKELLQNKDETLRKILDYYGIAYNAVRKLPEFPWSRKNESSCIWRG